MYAADQLGAKKGCLLIQLPPKIKANRTGQLERLLDRILRSDPQRTWKLAVEFRDKSWYRTEVETLLTQSCHLGPARHANIKDHVSGRDDVICLREISRSRGRLQRQVW